MFSRVRLSAVAVLIIFGLAIVAPNRTRSQTQNTSAAIPTFEYDVASIRADKSDRSRFSLIDTPDGLSGINVSLQALIQRAYGIQNYQLLGAPDSLNSERYAIDTKMDATTAEAVQKLSPDDRNLAREQMLRALLADRFKLTIHRESKELSVYFLIIAKNGPKLHQSKPGDQYSNGFKDRDGVPFGAGRMSTTSNGVSATMTAQAIPMTGLAANLAGRLGRPVLDKTALTGNYDFKLQFAPDQLQATPASVLTDRDDPSLLTAIQQQLGLKLESGKGPVEVIVIDHVERPSRN
jgi:uncharacterized protein (TIGR03435 family)